MKLLQDLLYKIDLTETIGDLNLGISEVFFDSRKVTKDSVFVAVSGTNLDGNIFIEEAIKKGAIAIVSEKVPSHVQDNITYIKVNNARKALSVLASNFYNNPSSKIKLIGVTGTNGKTTVVNLLFQFFQLIGEKCGMLSTIDNRINNYKEVSALTTLDPVSINYFINKMVEDGCRYCFMEVSSHALSQMRVFGLNFNVAVFLNISHDHLDYHKSFDNYLSTKKSFFDLLEDESISIINQDDKHFADIIDNIKSKYYTFSFNKSSDFKGSKIECNFNYSILNFNGQKFKTKLIGDFNFYNLLAVYSVINFFKKNNHNILKNFEFLNPPSGRMQKIQSLSTIIGLVDYAHTPDALEKVLLMINSLKQDNQSVITVFGCGGDRDKSKRSKMGKIAFKLSDKIVITSDNPRTENPLFIIEEIKSGIHVLEEDRVFVLEDRLQAIQKACDLAEKNDIILIAGKGHEKYQDINGEKIDFDDVQTLQELLKKH